MKAVRCCDNHIQVVDVPAPCGEGVLVNMRSAGICGSDIHMLNAGFNLPSTLGHEVAGTLRDGRAVALEPIAPCGHCDMCVQGDYSLCRLSSSMVYGVGRDGGMAEQIIVPASCLVPLPHNVSVADACLVEPLAVAEYDFVVECAGNSAALQQAASLCKPGATILLLATYWQGVTLPAFEVSMKALRIYASSMYDRLGLVRDVDVAAQLLAQRPELPDILITHRLPLDAAAEAFAIAANREAGAIKVVLEP